MHSDRSASDGEQYLPETSRKLRKFKRWTSEENLIYINFLVKEKQNFKDERVRRTSKIFKIMSENIGTKDQNQCKSHHQKMMKQYETIENIVQHFSRTTKKNTEYITNSSSTNQQPEIPSGRDTHTSEIQGLNQSIDGKYEFEQSRSQKYGKYGMGGKFGKYEKYGEQKQIQLKEISLDGLDDGLSDQGELMGNDWGQISEFWTLGIFGMSAND